MSLFLKAGARLSWSLPSIIEQQVCSHRLLQYMYAVLAEASLTRISSNTESTMDARLPRLHAHNHIISNSVILNNNCFIAKWLRARLQVFWKWHCSWSHSSSVTGSNHLIRLQNCEKAMGWCTAEYEMRLFCAKTIAKESHNFELARLKKTKTRRKRRRRRRRRNIVFTLLSIL